jgi:hypothetical protein
MNPIQIICTLILLQGLAGCATEPTTLEDGQSKVNLQAQPGDEMIARRLDGEQSKNLKYFIVSSGEHQMELGIVKWGYRERRRPCLATLSYKGFLPNQSYDLVESSSLGRNVSVALIDSKGNTIAKNDKVACL